MPPSTYVLTERRTAECRLSPADVDALCGQHRAHLHLVPTGRSDHYRVTPTGHVGTIVAPDCRLVIRPKIPIRNLFHLLDPLGTFPVAVDLAGPETGTDLFDFLAGRLVRLLTERAAAGLHRAYVERADSGPFLQGRLDVSASLRAGSGRRDQLHCRYEEFTVNVPCNQVSRSAAEVVLRSPLLGDGVRAALHRSLAAFAQVQPVALGPDSFQAAAPDRLTEPYRPLLDLCRLLVESLEPGEASGPIPCPAFLLDMERVFEQYVTQGVICAFAADRRRTVRVQPAFTANQPVAGQPNIHVRPDVLIEHGGRPAVVLDAKWKRGAGSLPLTADLYQVLAYVTALAAPRAVLVYPGRRDRAWIYRLARTPVEVTVRTLRVVGSRAACARSLSRMGSRLSTLK